MIARLTKMPGPPSNPADFMTDFDAQYRVDVTLARGLAAVLPQITEYLDTDDSQDVLKELTNDSRNVHKDRAPRMVEWGNTIEVTPVASGSKPQYSGPSSP